MVSQVTDPVIAVHRLSVVRARRRVLHDISLNVGKGETHALLGGNGAGKSTLLMTLLGMLPAQAGTARVLGLELPAAATEVRRRVAYLPESAALYGHLNARENLAYFLSLAGVPAEGDALEQALDTVALSPEARGRALDGYSKGMRQKVAIALAILRGAPVLLLDEPTSGLDPIAIDEFNLLVSRLRAAGMTSLVVTHDIYGACQIAQRIDLLHEGRIVGSFAAKADSCIDPSEVRELFAKSLAA